MVVANALVQTRVEERTKQEAAAALKLMGLTISDAVRLLLTRVARDGTLPFDVRLPNASTHDAMAELEGGHGVCFDDVEALMADLRADD